MASTTTPEFRAPLLYSHICFFNNKKKWYIFLHYQVHILEGSSFSLWSYIIKVVLIVSFLNSMYFKMNTVDNSSAALQREKKTSSHQDLPLCRSERSLWWNPRQHMSSRAGLWSFYTHKYTQLSAHAANSCDDTLRDFFLGFKFH